MRTMISSIVLSISLGSQHSHDSLHHAATSAFFSILLYLPDVVEILKGLSCSWKEMNKKTRAS
jgi:hypothetical protein